MVLLFLKFFPLLQAHPEGFFCPCFDSFGFPSLGNSVLAWYQETKRRSGLRDVLTSIVVRLYQTFV